MSILFSISFKLVYILYRNYENTFLKWPMQVVVIFVIEIIKHIYNV